LILSTAITGIGISLLELGCTGQVYVPIISLILQNSADNAKALFFLIVYNLAFILPLLIIFALFLFGTTHEKLTKWFQKHLIIIKFAMGIIFLILAIIILGKIL